MVVNGVPGASPHQSNVDHAASEAYDEENQNLDQIGVKGVKARRARPRPTQHQRNKFRQFIAQQKELLAAQPHTFVIEDVQLPEELHLQGRVESGLSQLRKSLFEFKEGIQSSQQSDGTQQAQYQGSFRISQ